MRDEYFEWDDAKAETNLRKHGVGFAEASTVLADPNLLTLDDSRHSTNEDRQIAVGYSNRLRILMVIHVERGQRWRIISARRSTAHEAELYFRPR